jgi:NADH-quinone oxidoreductase subunit M
MMRVSFPMFPDAAMTFAPIVGGIGVFGILYGALCALAQTDWKRLVAYSSVSHMGFVTLGLAAATPAALSGAYFQMISHGITSAMMFFLVGVVYERAHHRDINALGGLWNHWPAYGAWSLIGFFAGMGLPGLCGFVGEIMVLLGTFAAADSTPWMTPAAAYSLGIFAALGVVLSAAYILWMFQRIYLGKAPETHYRTYEPISGREQAIMVSLGVLAIVLGVVPALVFSMTGPTMKVLAEILTGGPVGALAGAAP